MHEYNAVPRITYSANSIGTGARVALVDVKRYVDLTEPSRVVRSTLTAIAEVLILYQGEEYIQCMH